MSKMTGPIGPPGFNGSQGTAGSRGAGDFSSCQYKVKAGDVNPGTTKALVDDTEPTVSMVDSYVFCFQNEICCIYFVMSRSQ